MEQASSPPRSSDRRLYLIWAAWTLLASWVAFRHELWFDELQAWTIARDSRSVTDLLHNIRWEGHPPLWYAVLWPVTRLSDSPHAMQLLNLVVCSGTALILLRHLRLPLVARAALVFGYYPLYELGAISRGYGLMCLLGVSAVVLARRTKRPNVPAAVALLLMAMTEVVAVPLALAFVVGLWMVPWWREREREWRTGALLGAVTAFVFIAALLARPTSGGRAPRSPHAPTTDSLIRASSAIGKALVPIPDLVLKFWNTSLLGSLNAAIPWVTGIALFMVVLVAVRRTAAAFMLWFLGVGGYAVLAMSTWKAVNLRHSSVVWLALMMILMVLDPSSRWSRERMTANAVHRWGVVFVAVAGLIGSAVAVVQEARHEFSGAHAAALWLEDRMQGDFVVLCASDMWLCTSVSMRMNVDEYQHANADPLSFTLFKKGWLQTSTPPERALTEAAALQRRVQRDVVIVGRDGALLEGCVARAAFSRTVVEPMTLCIAPRTSGVNG